MRGVERNMARLFSTSTSRSSVYTPLLAIMKSVFSHSLLVPVPGMLMLLLFCVLVSQVQIYGPLRLSCDIEKIVLDESYKEKMTGLLEEIKQQYGIPYEWQRFQLTQEEEIYKTVTLLLTWFSGKMWGDGVIFWSWLQVLKAFSFSLTGTM